LLFGGKEGPEVNGKGKGRCGFSSIIFDGLIKKKKFLNHKRKIFF